MRGVYVRMLVWISIALVAGCIAPKAGTQPEATDDYSLELTGLDSAIVAANAGVEASQWPNRDLTQTLRLVYLVTARAELSGDFAHLAEAEGSINAAIDNFGPVPVLLLSRVSLNISLHRLDKADRDLLALSAITDHPLASAMRADILVQRGLYRSAGRLLEALVEKYPNWDFRARLAHYRLNTNQPEEAERLYQAARNTLSAKQMRQYAWLELQKGIADLQSGRYQQALAHYRQAESEYSGYWLIEEHIAEVLHLLGRTEEAVSLYERIIAKTSNPVFMTALAAVVESTDGERARFLRKQAEAIYGREYAVYPEAVVGQIVEHQLGLPDSDPLLIEYAKQNYRWRPSVESTALLARSYLKINNPMAAKSLLDKLEDYQWKNQTIMQLKEQVSSAMDQASAGLMADT